MVNPSLRQLILKRDKKTCRLCKETKNESDLEIHHIKHEKSEFKEIITTDSTCHTRCHAIETTLRKGSISALSCGRCKDRPRLLQHKLSNNSEIRICPNCLRGDLRASDGSIEGIWLGVEPLQILKKYLIEEGVNLDPPYLFQERDHFVINFQDNKPEWYQTLELAGEQLVFEEKCAVYIDLFEGPFYTNGKKTW